MSDYQPNWIPEVCVRFLDVTDEVTLENKDALGNSVEYLCGAASEKLLPVGQVENFCASLWNLIFDYLAHGCGWRAHKLVADLRLRLVLIVVVFCYCVYSLVVCHTNEVGLGRLAS